MMMLGLQNYIVNNMGVVRNMVGGERLRQGRHDGDHALEE